MLGISTGFVLSGFTAIATITMIILLGIWTYKDAENKGMIPLLWTAIVVLVPSFIGLIVYLIVRTDNNKIVCSNCNTKVNSNMKYCSNCGMELKAADINLDEQTKFKNGQKKLLIGIFISMGVNIVCTVMMVVSFVIGAINIAQKTIDWAGNIDVNKLTEDVTDVFTEFDKALGNEDFNIKIKDDVIVITDESGKEILKMDGNNDEININSKQMREYIKEHGGDEISDDDIKDLEEALEDAIEENVETNTEKNDD